MPSVVQESEHWFERRIKKKTKQKTKERVKGQAKKCGKSPRFTWQAEGNLPAEWCGVGGAGNETGRGY